jgi:4-nitrophenyl phosphatase
VVGQEGLAQALAAAGFVLAHPTDETADAVVAGIDFGLTYDKLRRATLFIRRGARFIGTNGDLTYPSEVGLVPGAGSILAAIQAATDVAPTVIGKPGRPMFDAAVARLGRPRERTAMLGDRLDTDILGAQRAGLKTILVTTGIDGRDAVEAKGIVPDAVYESLVELVAAWHRKC